MMNFKKYIPHASIFAFFIILSVGLFPDAFKGKVIEQPDMMSFRGIGSDAQKLQKETGEIAVWTNSSFSGMPNFIWGGAPYAGNKLKPLQKWFLWLGLPNPSSFFLGAFLSFFILMLALRMNLWVALIGSLAFGLCTYNFLISEAGHGSKFVAISYFPLVAAGTILTYRGKYIIGALIFGFGLGLDLMAGHVQMTYYLAICMALYVLVKFVFALREKTLKQFGIASLVLLIPLMLAVGSNASRLWTAHEYMKETIRGPQLLSSDKGNSTTGLDKDYVFNWSQGISESLTFLIPGAFGGASSQPMDKDFATYKFLKNRGVGAKGLKTAPLYWGDLPSTSGPIYFGAISWLLFILGLLLVKGPIKWWLLLSTGLVILLSWGRHFMGFNDLFYNYFPLYDKFRAVSSILAVLQLTVPLLGVFALTQIIDEKIDKAAAIKKLYIAGGFLAGVLLLFGLMGSSFFDFTGPNDLRLKDAGYDLGALTSDRKMMLRNDAWRSLLFIVISSGLIWMYLKDKLNQAWGKNLMLGLFALLMLIDLGGVGKRYLNSDNFVREKSYSTNFSPRPVDNEILKDKALSYRIFDMSIATFNSNRASQTHKTIGGYHAAKLRRYNDMIEKHIGVGNQKVLDMLNTKYFITRESQIQQNPGALGNAWFIQNVSKVATHDEEINALTTIDPKTTAVVHDEFDTELGGFSNGSGQGTITLDELKPNYLKYTTNSDAEQLAVFSEVIYRPNSKGGWKSYIDGKPANHFRANYILRAMKVPSGQHTIEFKFHPISYYTGEWISLFCSLGLILGSIGFLVFRYKNRTAVKEDK